MTLGRTGGFSTSEDTNKKALKIQGFSPKKAPDWIFLTCLSQETTNFAHGRRLPRSTFVLYTVCGIFVKIFLLLV